MMDSRTNLCFGCGRTLQIAENLWNYLDRTSKEPDRLVLGELIAMHVDLGDLYAAGRDASAAGEQYRGQGEESE